MAVRDLVLSQIIERRGYGYDLADRLSDLFRTMQLSNAAMYSALKALEKDKLIVIVGREVGPDSRASTPRKIYEATPEGEAHHRKWMAAKAEKTPLREELHMQMMVAEDDDIPALLDGLDQVEKDCQSQLADVIAFSQDTSAQARISEFGAPLVRDGMAMHLQSTMEWVERSRRALRNRLGETHSGVPRRHRP